MNKLFLILCLILNILHLYRLFVEYFAFDVVTNVSIEMPFEVIYPDTLICIRLANLIDWKLLSHEEIKDIFDYNNGNKIFKSIVKKNKFSEQDLEVIASYVKNDSSGFIANVAAARMFRRLSIKEILSKTYKYEPNGVIGGSIETPDELLIFDRFYNQTVVSSFILGKDKCFMIRIKNKLTAGLYFLEKYTQNQMFHWSIRKSFSETSIKFSILPPGYPGIQYNDPVIIESNDKTTIRTITYDVLETNLMEYPYKTRCIDYALKGHVTQNGCIHDCVKKLVLKHQFGWGFSVISEKCMGNENDTEKYESTSLDNDRSTHTISEECLKQCKALDCKLIRYTARLIRTKLSRDKHNRDNYIFIEVISSKYPVIKTETVPAIPMITFITNFLSTFGIWFGLSLLSGLQLIELFVRRLLHATVKVHLNQMYLRQMKVNPK